MSLQVAPQANGFGAAITGVNLSQPLGDKLVQAIRDAWLQHLVVYFPDQPLTHTQFEAFTRNFGNFGEDPYVAPIEGHDNILEIRREPTERVSPFGASWHSDWSFQLTPPSATLLHAKIVPPVGGNTLYADGYRAYDALEPSLQEALADLTTTHSARRPYSHEGFLASGGKQRSMRILPSDSALATQIHPLVRTHPETGRKALWVNPVYTLKINELPEGESLAMLSRLNKHATRPEFIYEHRWRPNMLTMWDNRCVQHCAQGGYDGHLRVMHRTTVAGDQPA